MTELFLKVFNMSISASWLVLAVLVLRFALKKAPKWVSVLLWGIVALRLLCPFSLESALSLIPSAETVSPRIMLDTTPEIRSGVGAIDAVVNPAIAGSNTPAHPGASVNPLQITFAIWANLWLLGVLAMALYAAVSYWRLRRKAATAVRLEGNVFQSERVASPFILGVFRPRIYLPFSMGEEQQSYVLAHERAHLKRRDHLWKPLGYALLCLHWFNPLLWLSYVLLCRDIERACDEKVVRELGGEERADYSEALLACSVSRRSIAACPLAFGEVGVKERVKSVLSYKKPAFWLVALSLIVCAAVAVCFLTDPKGETGNGSLKCALILPDTGSSIVPPRWYPDGFDFDYDALTASEIIGTERLVFEADWDTEALIVGVDYYEALTDGAARIDRQTHTLDRREDGTFTMMAEHKTPGREETAVCFIEGADGGEYVMKLHFPAEPTARDVVVSTDADLDHDGESETIYVRTLAEDKYYELSVIEADGTLLYRTEAHTSHAGWATLLLYEDDGEDYLISYFPTMYQGFGTYEWTQFYLQKDEGEEVGHPVEVGSMRVEFEQPLTITSELSGFAERTNWLLQNSTVLLTTEQSEVVIGPVAATAVPQIYPVRFDPDAVSAEMAVSEPFADGQPMQFLFASGAGAWGTTLTLYPDGSFEGIYEDSDMGASGEGYPYGMRYVCEFTGRFGAMTKISDTAWSMRLEELTYEAAGREWIEDDVLNVSADPYGIAGGKEFVLYAPETPTGGLDEEFLWWSSDRSLYNQGTLTTLSRWGLHNAATGDGFFEYTPYAPSEEEIADTMAEHEGKVYFSDLLGYNGYMAVTETVGEFWTLRTYYAVENGEERPIAESFGLGEAQDYALDLDGDGVTELVANVTFGADGAQRVHVYQRRGDEIYRGTLQPDEWTDFNNWGANATWSEYDAASGVFRFHYAQKGKEDYAVIESVGLEHFQFEKYETSAN